MQVAGRRQRKDTAHSTTFGSIRTQEGKKGWWVGGLNKWSGKRSFDSGGAFLSSSCSSHRALLQKYSKVLWDFPPPSNNSCPSIYLAPNDLVIKESSGIPPPPQQSHLLKRISHLEVHLLLCLQQQPVARSLAWGLHFSLGFSASWRKVWAARASGFVHVRMVSWHVKFKRSHKLKLLFKQLEFLLTAAITEKCL